MDWDTDPETLDSVEDLRLLAVSLRDEVDSWRRLYKESELRAAKEQRSTMARSFDLVELALKRR